MRLIDADKLLQEIEFEYDLDYGETLINPRDFADAVCDSPTVDAVPLSELTALRPACSDRCIDYMIAKATKGAEQQLLRERYAHIRRRNTNGRK